MANIIKSSSGLLFSEGAWDDLSLLWDLSPNYPSRVALTSDSISLLPGEERMELLISAPGEKGYVLQSKIQYTPTTANEKGGNTLKSITNNYIDLEICGDNSMTCSFTKLIVDNDYILDAKASSDGITWTDYGNTKMIDTNKIGYYIESGASGTNALTIKDCIIYKSNNIVINNFDRKNVIKLFDKLGNEVTDSFFIKKKNTQIWIDGTNIIFPLDYVKVQVSDRTTGVVYHEGELENVYGGDVYEYDYDVEFYIDEARLDVNTFNLGSISRDKTYTLRISNTEGYSLNNKKLKVSYTSIYNQGYKLIEIAPENSNIYSTELDVSFEAGETKLFTLKASRNRYATNLDEEYKFNIILE